LKALKKPGVIICGSHDTQKYPPMFPRVEPDNNRVAELVARHLMQRKYRSFAFFYILKSGNEWATERVQAFCRYLRKGCYNGDVHIYGQTMLSTPKFLSLKAIGAWISRLPRPAGVFAANDERARLLLEACRVKNIKVPDEIAVIGVDNDETFCHLVDPPISSIIQDTERMGWEAAQLLHRLLSGHSIGKPVICVPPKGIVVRRSSDAMAIEHPVLQQVTAYIREHLSDIQTTDVARHVGITRNALDNLARQLTGQSIHELILSHRIIKTGELLLQTNLSLKEIADQVGFSSTQYMATVFARRTGRSPLAYRQQNRQSRKKTRCVHH